MATPAEFFDPFAKATLSAGPRHSSNGTGSARNDIFASDPEFSTIVSIKSVARKDPKKTEKELVTVRSEFLPVRGQGTISVESDAENLVRFALTSRKGPLGGHTLHLDVGTEEVLLYFDGTTERSSIPFSLIGGSNAAITLNPGRKTTYWLSVDSNNGLLRYGKYFTNASMTLIEARLKKKDDEGRLQWNDATKYSWIGDLGIATAVQDPIKNMPALDTIIDPLPVVISLSPFVLSADHISLEDLAAGIYTVPANLPEACQTLHNNVAGAKITLDDDNFPEFSKAIQRSCTTNGLWAFEKLKSKATEFGGPNETYLRITLGYNLGDSPGVPYVLEIWPSQHYSPIHDHGNACAVIKVLHGEITCTWYDTLDSPRAQVGSGKLHKGAITWIGDENYQIHKLENHSSEVCCTIQCYRYDGQDNVHYDGFNWVDGHGSVEKFVPNSDMDFLDFKRLMREEWYSQTTNNRNGHV